MDRVFEIRSGDTFTKGAYERRDRGRRWTFDYMLASPPFGVESRQQQKFITDERDALGHDGRFGAGLPRIREHMARRQRTSLAGPASCLPSS